MNYTQELIKYTDEQLLFALASPLPGSSKHEQIKFELQRRAMVAQKEAAEATRRGAIAAERYTVATWILVFVTVVGLLFALFK